MTATAVILAGGKGTRSADPTRAKLAQQVGGRSLLEWHLEVLAPTEIDEVLVVAGHLGQQVQELCAGIDAGGRDLRVIHEADQEGTVAALRLAADQAQAEEYLVILGDVLMSLPIQDFIDGWRASMDSVAVAVHPSLHPQDSDTCFPRHDGSILVVPKGQPRDHVPNMSSAGLFAIRRTALDRYGHLRDFGSALLPSAAQDRDLFAYVTSHYLKDTGTPTRLSDAQDDLQRGAFARRGSLHPRAALFLDRDGVINPAEPEFHEPSGYGLLPGVAAAIRRANRHGIPVIVLTNQPHIAKGFMTFDDHQRVRARMDLLLQAEGAFVDDYFSCPHHPDGGFAGEVPELKIACECRKPAPDLAHQAARRHRIDLSRSVMVGDTAFDRGLAHETGMHYIHVDPTCPDLDAPDCFPEPSAAIRKGIEVLGC